MHIREFIFISVENWKSAFFRSAIFSYTLLDKLNALQSLFIYIFCAADTISSSEVRGWKRKENKQ